MATEAAGTPAARFLPLPFSSLGQLVQPLSKGFIKKSVAVASSDLDVALEDSTTRQMALRTPPGGKGSRQQVGPGRTCRPQGCSPQASLVRGVQVLFVQESHAQAGGRNCRDDDGACIFWKGFPGLLGDLGA